MLMKISVMQPDLEWEDKIANFARLEKLIKPIFNKTDIVILPEMFSTGFSMNSEKLSESVRQETFQWMNKMSQNGNFGLCGSYIVKENEQFFNRLVFVTPEKEYWHYDKRHLFSIGGEDKYYSPGKSRLVFTFRGVRISPFICYDLRFPVWSRNRNDCDLIIYSANWPESRREVWNILLKARAIENQCYVAGSNRIGKDGSSIKYCGDSTIVSPRGEIIGSCISNEQGFVTTEISMTDLSDFRNKFAVQKGADNFSIDY